MYRLVVFQNGGTVELDRNAAAIPTTVVNQLIVEQCIAKSHVANEAQLRLGKAGEYSARLARDSKSNTNVALIFPASLKPTDPHKVVADILKIRVADFYHEKFATLVDMRLSQLGFQDDAEVSEKGEEKAETKKKRLRQRKTKKKRNSDGTSDNEDNEVLDYSEATSSTVSKQPVFALDAKNLGEKSKRGFVVKELTNELGDILDSSDNEPERETLGFLKRFVGGKKLSDEELKSVLNAMEDHLVTKNVAKEVATAICERVRKDLVGTSTKSWTTVKETVKGSVRAELSQILTPSSSEDLLAAINKKKSPYVISVVGVNGVGKSTNLGKLGFWFLQNDFKVLVVACDTFRSGAVEQLRVHVDRLRQMKGTHGEVELYDQGYGKDAAVIAKKAVEHATANGFDVVLIDTAGRRHNDDRLMSNLERFGNMANPDKIIMVGEALVGTDSVEQARNFDAAFGKSRGLDFFLISKCDTVGEMLGTLVNVTYATGVPVLFVGVGQQYTDLRTLNVDWAVNKLL